MPVVNQMARELICKYWIWWLDEGRLIILNFPLGFPPRKDLPPNFPLVSRPIPGVLESSKLIKSLDCIAVKLRFSEIQKSSLCFGFLAIGKPLCGVMASMLTMGAFFPG